MSLDSTSELLSVRGLTTGYGKKRVLEEVSLKVVCGEIVAVIGHNGAGKSTLLRAIFGLLPIWSGDIAFQKTTHWPLDPSQLLQMGIAFVPQGNRVFTDLTVLENLRIVGSASGRQLGRERLDRVFSMFPRLRPLLQRPAGTLSGGERQILALAVSLVSSPRLLLLDEPSLGLAPRPAAETLTRLKELSTQFGSAILVVEQKVREILKVADRVYVMRNGRVSFSGAAQTLASDDILLRRVYL